jgi:O-succinylbenzoic acid--CoA ligase
MKPLRLIPANDTFRALSSCIEMLDGKIALFITEPELNGLMPEVHGLPNQVSDEVALIVESSGSTGTPKRIELSASALKASAKASAERLGGEGQWLLALPTKFIAGVNVLIRSVIADTQPVIMNTQLPFTADAFFRAASLMTEQKRFTSLVPAQLARLLEAVRTDAYSLKLLRRFDAILVGGQMPDTSVVEELRALGVNIVISYGMSETAGGCVYDSVPLSGVSVNIRDGRIAISGAVLANGLAPEFLTSDLGETRDGQLMVTGRADRVIISGGHKVSLEAIEAKAAEIAGVSEVAAAAVATSWGESVGLVYSGTPVVDFTSLETLSVAAKPHRVLHVEALPRLVSGKADLVAIAKLLSE